MVQSLELRVTQSGVIWPRKPVISANGLLASIRSLPMTGSSRRKHAGFQALAFNPTGEALAAADEKGRLFVFFVTTNRYSLVQHVGARVISCCFNPVRKFELLVSCENNVARCIDVSTQELISTLRGHPHPAPHVDFQKSGKLALTASKDSVSLWETKDWSRYRVLSARPDVAQARFVPNENLVAVCFHDSLIMMWDLDTFAVKHRFSLAETEFPPGLRQFSISSDLKMLIASGRASLLYIWDFQTHTVVRVIELPSPIDKVMDHVFVPGYDNLLMILGGDGTVFCLDVSAKSPTIKSEIACRGHKITKFAVECHARYLSACTQDGSLLFFDMNVANDFLSRPESSQKVKKTSRTRPSTYRSKPVLPYERIQAHSTTKRKSTVQHSKPHHQVSKKALVSDSCSPTDDVHRMHPFRESASTLSPFAMETNKKRLEGVLNAYGAYPKKYRLLAWRFLLQLPKNETAFRHLVARGRHESVGSLEKRYPLRDQRLLRRLKKILSALAYWCPAFQESDYVPSVVYPFVKVFQSNDLAAFETSVVVLTHYCSSYLSHFPHSPAPLIHFLDQLLGQVDLQLRHHLIEIGVDAELYIWRLLQTLLTEVLTENAWMMLFDYIFTYPDQPELLYAAVIAFLRCSRSALLAAQDRISIETFFQQQNVVNVEEMLQVMQHLSSHFDLTETVKYARDSNGWKYWPLPQHQYPAFGNYPRQVVEQQILERRRIEKEERQVEEKRDELKALERKVKELEEEDRKRKEEKKRLRRLEEERSKSLVEEERKRMIELREIEKQSQEKRMEQIQMLEKQARERLQESSAAVEKEYERVQDMVRLHREKIKFQVDSKRQKDEMELFEMEAFNRVQHLEKEKELEQRIQALRNEFYDQLQLQSYERPERSVPKTKVVDWERPHESSDASETELKTEWLPPGGETEEKEDSSEDSSAYRYTTSKDKSSLLERALKEVSSSASSEVAQRELEELGEEIGSDFDEAFSDEDESADLLLRARQLLARADKSGNVEFLEEQVEET